MKEYIKYLPLLLLSIFFIIPGKVDAKNIGISYDANEHYNYFYEQRTNTPFYRFLNTQGDELIHYVDSLVDHYWVNYYKNYNFIFIYYVNDWQDYFKDTAHDYIPTNAKYVIHYGNYDGGICNLSLRVEGDFIKVGPYEQGYQGSQPCSDANNVTNSSLLFFDENANYLSTIDASFIYTSDLTFSFKTGQNTTLESIENSSYLISMLYYIPYKIEYGYDSTKPKFILSDLYLNNQQYLVNDSSQVSSFVSFLRYIFSNLNIKEGLEKYDIGYTDLEYYSKYPIISKDYPMLCLFDVISYYHKSLIDTDRYSSIDLSSYENGIYLVPKITKENELFNDRFYFQTTINDINLKIRAYDISSDLVLNTLPNTDGYTHVIPIGEDFSGSNITFEYSSFTHLYEFSSQMENFEADKYIYYISVDNYRDTFYFYYDKSTFDFYEITGGDKSFINPNTGNTITFDSSTQNKYNNSSDDIFNEQIKENDKLTSSSSSNKIDLSSFTSRITDFVNGFSGVVSSLFVMTGILFTSLPTEVQSVFYFILFSGLIILIWRLLKGGS